MTNSGPAAPTPLELLGVLASQDVAITPSLRHLEFYCPGGLLTMLWHGEPDARGAVIALGGAMGGLLGPAGGLYHDLGVELAATLGLGTIRVSYRAANDLDSCCVDAAAAVQLAIGNGAERVVLLGHSFGGAVAVRVGVALPDMVAGVVTFATQSAGCEVAAGLAGRPFLLFHGERDEILPMMASEVVREIAGTGELVICPNDGHLFSRSREILWERMLEWIPEVLAVSS
ncbi:MAG: dienelactone hydrolase family protein [Acidimicrobiales bacterium]